MTIWFLNYASTNSTYVENHSSNISNVDDNFDLNSIASVYSPRMDFDQWKPLTGRGDPLRNDPTYDYEPPLLEKVHYWAEDNLPHREKHTERKSEVLMLGVSSRKPSAASRPIPPIKRLPRPPAKYEDFSYKFSDHYPMTILVPPPPPPPSTPSHQPSLFAMSKDKFLLSTPASQLPDGSLFPKESTTELLTSFALQESNLIYQSSTTKDNWLQDYNKTTNLPNNTVSSDYAGWGPTTPIEDYNESHNIISHSEYHNIDFTKQPLSYYKPTLSEAPPPPPQTLSHSFTVFLPTILPPTLSTIDYTQEIVTSSTTESIPVIPTETEEDYKGTTTEKIKTQSIQYPTKSQLRLKPNILDMLGPMISMPMITDPERPEDHLYAHASSNIHVFQEPTTEDPINLEIMQTMQPPPPIKDTESSTFATRQQFKVNPHVVNNQLRDKPMTYTHDPYLHMRFTTSTTTAPKTSQEVTLTTESTIPTYLIIQGHSKVKTYGSKPHPDIDNKNEILNPNETNEVKHLHPIKSTNVKQSTELETKNREGRAQNLKSLLENGLGSIEIQEADVGIKYDVSDGSDVPIEIYKKGIVDNDNNHYVSKNQIKPQYKRQINEDVLKEIISDSDLKEITISSNNNKDNNVSK